MIEIGGRAEFWTFSAVPTQRGVRKFDAGSFAHKSGSSVTSRSGLPLS